MDAAAWDARYAASEQVWSSTPNAFVAEIFAGQPPQRALDVAAGEGRNAIWLVGEGWRVTATDFSPVAVDRINGLGRARLGKDAARLDTYVADATAPATEREAFDAVLFCYLQIEATLWRLALASGADAAIPGGQIVVIMHAKRNLTEGVGGPQDPGLLYDPDEIVSSADGLGLIVEDARPRTRLTADGVAHDSVVRFRRV